MNLHNLILQRARPDGQPVFWLSRGNEYAIAGGRMEAVGAKVIVQCVRYVELGQGTCKIAYVERTHLVEPSTFKLLPADPNRPQSLSSQVSAAGILARALHVDASGKMTQTATNPDGSITEYRGQVREEAGFDGAVHVSQSITITFFKDRVPVESFLTEFTTVPRGQPEGGFLPCDITITVAREKDPRLKARGEGVVIATNYGKKYATADAMRTEMGPVAAHFAEFFDQWPQIMK